MGDIFLKQIQSILNNYGVTIKNYHFYPPKKLGKVEKLAYSIEDKEKYVIHRRALKQALNHGLVLKYVHRVIKFNQKPWLKLYIDMKTKLRTETAPIDFAKFEGQIYIYDNMKDGKTTLQQVEKQQKD